MAWVFFDRSFNAIGLVGQQGFVNTTPGGKIHNEFQPGPRGQKLQGRRRAKQGAPTMGFVIDFEPVAGGEAAGMIEYGQVFLGGKMVAAGVRIEIKRFQQERAFVLPLKTRRVFRDRPAAGAPLLGHDGEAGVLELAPRKLARGRLQRHVQFDTVKAVRLDFFKFGLQCGAIVQAPDRTEKQDFHKN